MAERDDERRHEPHEVSDWSELFAFDFAAGTGLGGSLHLGFRPQSATAWCWADLVLPDGRPVLVHDHEIPMSRSDALTVRAEGLWAEMVCETPMEHWSLGLEAFGVILDDPLDAFEGEVGERVPVGLDLEWEAYTPPWFAPETDPEAGGDHYEHAGIVHGEILVGNETIEFDGRGARRHRWGFATPGAGWHRAAFQLGDGIALAFEVDAAGVGDGFEWRAGDELIDLERVLVETHLDADGLPTAAR